MASSLHIHDRLPFAVPPCFADPATDLAGTVIADDSIAARGGRGGDTSSLGQSQTSTTPLRGGEDEMVVSSGGGGGGGGGDDDDGSDHTTPAPSGTQSVLRFRNLSYSVRSHKRKSRRACSSSDRSEQAPMPQLEGGSSKVLPVAADIADVAAGSVSNESGDSSRILGVESFGREQGVHRYNSLSNASNRLSSFGRSISGQIGGASRRSREILVDSYGCARSGQITAIMGASGAGKTTLLNILACRIASGRRGGEVELDGLPVRSEMMRRVSAYVMQDDLMFPSLTVRETLMFSAELRLPRSVRREVKAAKVQRLLDLLGLAGVAETRIGDEGQRGVSGGERKRVAIGTEIICNPRILFLDEPTSGLDSTSAFRVVRAIKDIAVNTNGIAVMVLHQPSFRVLSLVDSLLLLAAGHTVFHGAPSALPHFVASVGFPVPQFANSTEHALDLFEDLQRSRAGMADFLALAREYRAEQEEEERRKEEKEKVGFSAEAESTLKGADSLDAEFRLKLQLDGSVQEPGSVTKESSPETMHAGEADGERRFWSSKHFHLIKTQSVHDCNEDMEAGRGSRNVSSWWGLGTGRNGEAQSGESGGGVNKAVEGISLEKGWKWGRNKKSSGGGMGKTKSCDGTGERRRYGNGWFAELAVLTRRNALITFRTPGLYLLRLGLIAITGILLATIFFKPDESMKGFQERLAYFSFTVCTLFFVSCDAVPMFIQERNIFLRETSSSAYRPSTYLLSASLVYLPLHLLMSLTLVLEAWWCVGLQGGAQGFCFMLLTGFAMLFTGNAIATCISTCVNHVALAYAVVIALMSYFALLSGFYINRESIPDVWIWLHYLSPMKYAYEALVINEFARPGGPCYMEAGSMFEKTPVAPYINGTIIKKTMVGMQKVLSGTPYSNITTSTCLQDGPQLLTNVLSVNELDMWGNIAVLAGYGVLVRIATLLILTWFSKAKKH